MDRRLQAQIEADPVLQEAAEWLLELRSGNVSSQRITEWQRWLSEAAHRQAFDRVESLWHMTAEVNARWPSEAELTLDRYIADEGISAWRARAGSDVSAGARRHWLRQVPQMLGAWPWRRARFFTFSASAVAAAIVMLLVYWPTISVFLHGGTRISLHTGIGESRTFTLQDGTVISVGPDTTLTATLGKHFRTVALQSGDAYFRVRKDPAKPFTVHAGRSTVTDLGTVFDVRHVGSGIVVSVAEGVVRVTAALPQREPGSKLNSPNADVRRLAMRVTAGQRLAMEPFDTAPRISSIDRRWVAGWRRGHLYFLDEPLGSVVADLNRYSTRRIIVADPDIARLRVTAAVSVHDIDSWLASLRTTFSVRVVRRVDHLIIEPR